jgi:hypothetical protein
VKSHEIHHFPWKVTRDFQDLTFGAALDPGVDRLQRGCSPNRRLFLWVLLAGEIRINHDLVGFNGI